MLTTLWSSYAIHLSLCPQNTEFFFGCDSELISFVVACYLQSTPARVAMYQHINENIHKTKRGCWSNQGLTVMSSN